MRSRSASQMRSAMARSARAARNMRAMRERQRRGICAVVVHVDEVPTTEALIACGLLAPRDAENKAALAEALEKVLQTLTKGEL